MIAAKELIASFGGTASVDATEAAQAADDAEDDPDDAVFWWAVVEKIRQIQGA